MLHEDDPVAIDVVLRHMYDLPCNDALNEWSVSLESLAMIYVTADKYHVVSLKEKVHHKIQKHANCKRLSETQDFLEALAVIITGTTQEDKGARATMINACVKHIEMLQKSSKFSALLRKYGDIGAEILQHDRLPLMLEGTWQCGRVYRHAEAVPSCRKCHDPYSESYVRSHRHLKIWKCPNCQRAEQPVCLECGDEGECMFVNWQWRGESG